MYPDMVSRGLLILSYCERSAPALDYFWFLGYASVPRLPDHSSRVFGVEDFLTYGIEHEFS
jgi:hypothetical protein